MAKHLPVKNYQETDDAFKSGAILGKSTDELRAYLIALNNQPLPNETTRHRDIIRGLTINHILLQRHIDEMQRRSLWLTWLVVLLTVTSTAFGGLQIWYADKADKRESTRLLSEQAARSASSPAGPAQPSASASTK